MTVDRFKALWAELVVKGFESEIVWQEHVTSPTSADSFAYEAIFVICNSGMKAQVARGIYDRIQPTLQLLRNQTDSTVIQSEVFKVFKNKNKVRAIASIWANRYKMFYEYRMKSDHERLDYLETIPHIGPIIKYHLAKNFGIDCCKPDRHLMRISAAAGETPEKLCSRIAKEVGLRVATVDYIIWRGANLGLV